MVEAVFENVLSMEAAYGVICRHSEAGWYEFRIYVSGPKAGAYTMFKYDANLKAQYKNPLVALHAGFDHYFTYDIRLGINSQNKLGLRCEGNQFRIYINEKEQLHYRNGQITDDSFSSGTAGVAVQSLGDSSAEIGLTEFRVSGTNLQETSGMGGSQITETDSPAVIANPQISETDLFDTAQEALPEPRPVNTEESVSINLMATLAALQTVIAEAQIEMQPVEQQISPTPPAELLPSVDSQPTFVPPEPALEIPTAVLLPTLTSVPASPTALPAIPVVQAKLGQKVNCGNQFQFEFFYQPTVGSVLSGKVASDRFLSFRAKITNLTNKTLVGLPARTFKAIGVTDGIEQEFPLNVMTTLLTSDSWDLGMIVEELTPGSTLDTFLVFSVPQKIKEWYLDFVPIEKLSDGPFCRIRIKLPPINFQN